MFFGGNFPPLDGAGFEDIGGGMGCKPADTTKFYELLEVDKNASGSEIKKAYRKLAIKHHPDRGGDPEKFKEITHAYEVLSDPDKRSKYDRYGEEAVSGEGAGLGADDIFDSFFGGGSRGGGGVAGGGGNIGLTVGGAQDVGSFRKSIEAGRMPLLSSLTVEGLFSEYYFETGDEWQCVNSEQSSLFWPAYSFARCADPLACKSSGEDDEIWMSVGLNSSIQQQDFQRKNLNLALVLDISGSMGRGLDLSSSSSTKLNLAKASVEKLLLKLRREDRVAIVLFDDCSEVLQPLISLAEVDMAELQAKLKHIRPRGGTSMESGLREALNQLESVAACTDPNFEENRVIFLTDDMPNIGCTSGDGMLSLVHDAAQRNIYTSLLGVGLDFHTDVIEVMSKAKGAWYGSVKSSEEFQRRLDTEFDYMVTPLVFNVRLELHSDAFVIDRVFGSPEASAATGQLMYINSLFPSPKDDQGRTKGGVVLVRLLRKQNPEGLGDDTIRLRVLWENRNGEPDSNEQLVLPPAVEDVHRASGYYEGPGVRKALLLARYVSLLRQWIWDETCNLIGGTSICTNLSRGVFNVPSPDDGRKCPEGHTLLNVMIGDATSGHSFHSCDLCRCDITAPEHIYRCQTCDYDLCKSCYRVSADKSHCPTLRVSQAYCSIFERLKAHVEHESNILSDQSVMQEAETLDALLRVGRGEGNQEDTL